MTKQLINTKLKHPHARLHTYALTHLKQFTYSPNSRNTLQT